MEKPLRILKNPYLIFKYLSGKGLINWMPDKPYLKLMYRATTGEKLDLKNPKTFSEKLQWLKLYDRNPLYTIMVDKVKAKEYVAKKIGEKYIIPTLAVWENVEDIDFNILPNRFVIKCNHNSGKGMYICKDKRTINEKKVRERLYQGLKENYYNHGREWPYKDVPRRILVEKYMESSNENVLDEIAERKASYVGDLRDFKFFCFNGEPKLCQVISNRSSDERIDFYNMNWERIPGLIGLSYGNIKNSKESLPCPRSFQEMINCAKILSKESYFSRIDFYDIDGHAYWGEITFYPASGFGKFRPDKWNSIIGKWINIDINSQK